MTHPEEPTEWNSIFELLSLDRVLPFYEDMGLNLPDKERFVTLLRQMLSQSHDELGSDRVPDMDFVEKVLNEIRLLLGDERFEHFYRWATTVFYWAPSDQPQWSIWDHILPRRSHHLPRDLSPDRWSAVAEFQLSKSAGDVEQRATAQKHQPLSDWDAQMYTRHNYRDQNSPDDVFEEGIDPFSPVTSTIEMNRMQLAWPKLWAHFSDDEKNLFWRYGQAKLKEWEPEETVAGGVPHPDSLRRQL